MKSIAAIFLLAAAFLDLSGCCQKIDPKATKKDLNETPWSVEVLADNKLKVFNLITIGEDDAMTISEKVKVEPQIALFKSDDNKVSLEAFYPKININGFSGEMIANLELTDEWKEKAINDYVELKNLGKNEKQFFLSAKYYREATRKKSISLTYIASISLTEEMVIPNFGKPEKEIRIDQETKELLYPSKGIYILIENKKRGFIQYIPTGSFTKIFP